jgi:hypothetical protein
MGVNREKRGQEYTYLREKINLVKFNFVEKGGQPGKGDPDVECL